MEKANELWEQKRPIEKEIEKRCIDYLKRTLKNREGNRLDFYDEDGEPYGNQYLCVTYDGGRHPEYASNAFSSVKGVFLKENHIYLDTEDDDEYSITNISLNELFSIADYVYHILMPILKKG